MLEQARGPTALLTGVLAVNPLPHPLTLTYSQSKWFLQQATLFISTDHFIIEQVTI